MEEKKFSAELEIIHFDDTDVITTSCVGDSCIDCPGDGIVGPV